MGLFGQACTRPSVGAGSSLVGSRSNREGGLLLGSRGRAASSSTSAWGHSPRWHYFQRAKAKAQKAYSRLIGISNGDSGQCFAGDYGSDWPTCSQTDSPRAEPTAHGTGAAINPKDSSQGQHALLRSPTVPLEVVAQNQGTSVARAPPARAYRSLPDDEPGQIDGALLEQSKALAALVAHFQVGSADPMPELASSSGTMRVKGAMGREKLQREFAPVPQTETDLASVSMLSYLEKFGGFGQNRHLGLIMWSLAPVYDSASRENWGAVKDHLAMTCVMIDQLPWLLRLLDHPPSNLWMNRNTTATGARRPFAPLVPQSWATVALAFLKETEILNNEKQEVAHHPKTSSPASSGADPKTKTKPKKKPWQQKQAADQTSGAPDS